MWMRLQDGRLNLIPRLGARHKTASFGGRAADRRRACVGADRGGLGDNIDGTITALMFSDTASNPLMQSIQHTVKIDALLYAGEGSPELISTLPVGSMANTTNGSRTILGSQSSRHSPSPTRFLR